MMRTYLSRCLLLLLLGLIGASRLRVEAQAISNNNRAAFPENEFLLWDGSSLIQWQPSSLKQKLYLNLSDLEANRMTQPSGIKPNLGNVNIALDREHQYIYTLELVIKVKDGLPTATQLIQTDVFTHNQKSLLTKAGLFGILLSPDNNKILAIYFTGEYGSGQKACVLTITTGICKELGFLIAPKIEQWMDNETLVVLSLERKLYLVNSSTLEATPLSIPDTWDIVGAVPIPRTNSLLISANPRNYTPAPVQFLELDFGTMNVTDFPYDAFNSNYTSVQDWWFSPDSHYLLYGPGGTTGLVLVEFKTGQLIAELKDMYSPIWLPDSNGVLLHHRTVDQSSVIKFDLQTKQSTNLIADAGNLVVLQ